MTRYLLIDYSEVEKDFFAKFDEASKFFFDQTTICDSKSIRYIFFFRKEAYIFS